MANKRTETIRAIHPVPKVHNTKNSASGNTSKEKRKGLTATLVINGNPLIRPNTVITIQNVAQRHAGNWLVEKVKHDISADSAYKTTLELTKNATNKPLSNNQTKAKDVNKTQGPAEIKPSITISTAAKRHGGASRELNQNISTGSW